MKQAILVICTFFIASMILPSAALAQNNSDKIIFYGVDFTKAKLIGSEGFTNPQHLQSSYLRQWNNLIISESEKYDVKKAFGKSSLEYHNDIVNERNDAINPDELVINNTHKTTKEDVVDVVSKLGSKEHTSGTGAVIVVESFDKPGQLGTMWLTTFDIATLEIIKTKKMSAAPRGFGIRNYWARTIFLILERAPKEF